MHSEDEDALASRDLGIAFRDKDRCRRKIEANAGRLYALAVCAGVVGGQKVEANGSVSVVVQRPGPDTNVRTPASGNLFKYESE